MYDAIKNFPSQFSYKYVRPSPKRGLPLAAISIGGKLLERAEKDGIPYIQMPDTGIQPRSALGFLISKPYSP